MDELTELTARLTGYAQLSGGRFCLTFEYQGARGQNTVVWDQLYTAITKVLAAILIEKQHYELVRVTKLPQSDQYVVTPAPEL